MIVDIIYHNAEDQNWFQRREVIELSIWDWWQSGLRDKHRRLCDNSSRDNGDLNEHGIVEAKRTRWMGIFRMEKSRGLGDGLEMGGNRLVRRVSKVSQKLLVCESIKWWCHSLR